MVEIQSVKKRLTLKCKKINLFFQNSKKIILLKDDLIALRPRLKGISPINYKKYIGRRLKSSVKAETILKDKKIKY